MLRLTAICLAALLTSACTNMVTSETPLFPDKPSRAFFRPGLWIGPPSASCRFDPRSRRSEWPECAVTLIMTAHGPTPGKDEAYVLADGNPMILQIMESEAEPSGARESLYAAAAPTRRDRAGRITAVVGWPVQCGPPQKRRYAKGEPRPVVPDTPTLRPLPGLTMVDDHCLARRAATVRRAAARSRAWAPKPMIYRWVRDGTE